MHYFWDADARLLLIARQSDDVVFDLVEVKTHPAGGQQRILGCGTWSFENLDDLDVDHVSRQRLDYIVVPLPEISKGDKLRIVVDAFARPGDLGSPDHHVEVLQLVNSAPDVHVETVNWTIVQTSLGLAFDLYSPSEAPADGNVANVWASSCRGGVSLYPAYHAIAKGTLPRVRLDVKFEKDEDGNILFPMRLQLLITPFSLAAGEEVAILIYSLNADSQVQPLLTNNIEHVFESANETAVKVVGDRDDAQEAYVPLLHENNGRNTIRDISTGPGVWLDHLDRIVIKANPPVSFMLQIEDGTLETLNSTGTCAFAYIASGKIKEDGGALVDRLRDLEGSSDVSAAFLNHMADFGYQIDPGDLNTASEITLLAHAEVRRYIQGRYGAAAGSLLPADFQDYTAAPGFFGLAAVCARIEDLSELNSRLFEDGRDLGEAERVGHLAWGLLRDMLTADDGDPAVGRLQVWASEQLLQQAGWNIIPAVVMEDVRRGISAGLTWRPTELGGFIDFVRRPSNEDLIADMSTLLDTLTDLSVLPLDADKQLVRTSDARKRLDELKKLSHEFTDLIEEAERELGLNDIDRPRPREELLSDVRSEQYRHPKRLRGRVAALFKERLTVIDAELHFDGEALDLDKAWDVLAAHFLSRIDEDCDQIEGIIECGYADPVPGQLLSIDKPSGGIQSRPSRPLAPEQQSWLFDDVVRHPPLVEDWRRQLREDYEKANQSRSIP